MTESPTSPAAGSDAPAPGDRTVVLRGLLRRTSVLAALVLLVIVSSFLNDRFLSVPNLMNVLRQVSIVGILAVGMTFVIITKGIDLSVGSILGVSVVLFAGLLETQSMAVAIPLGILAAMGLGLVNGVGVALAGIPPFIMTLGTLSFARGLAFIYTGGTPIPILDEAFYDLGNGYTFGVPNPTLILIATLVISGVVLAFTPFGRSVYAIGSNEDAARLSGVPVGAYKTAVYVISGGVAGVAGLVYASQLSVGTPIAGQAYELDAIAAVVVGGTSLFGGKGSVAGTFVGTLIIGVLANILNLTGVDPFVQQLFKGALIVVAVFIMARSSRT
ncbi:ABC transporter permease [Jannaschia sp. W003]|uniref:ABC transporter permease n=1 Tax=Jannaschia sp. W003 TaxID=2867012 RepID=UPI0021A6E57C|nr:ABC transporter permease [Jannaschia sp. W003]UWQ21785.1 ABC transporter permease [Jannaschia sp. W003]